MIKKFIEDNKLDFLTDGTINTNCCILAGYICYLDLPTEELDKQIDEVTSLFNCKSKKELERLYKHAQKNDWGENYRNGYYKDTYIY